MLRSAVQSAPVHERSASTRGTRSCPHAGEHRKGKYAPLQALIPRMGAGGLLTLHPGLLTDTLHAMRVPAVCPSAAALLEALLRRLLAELSMGKEPSPEPPDRLLAGAALCMPMLYAECLAPRQASYIGCAESAAGSMLTDLCCLTHSFERGQASSWDGARWQT